MTTMFNMKSISTAAVVLLGVVGVGAAPSGKWFDRE